MIKIPSLRITTVFILLSLALNIHANEYEDEVDNWDSYQDVANWLNDNFKFNKQRQESIKERLQLHGPEGLLIRNPKKTFFKGEGYCADAAHFARESLNTIDPEYNAQWVFIDNAMQGPNHWVTGFYVDGDLYIMDYGAGTKWSDMQGTHGPYKSLDEYEAFLSSLDMPGFEVKEVRWREMPGKED